LFLAERNQWPTGVLATLAAQILLPTYSTSSRQGGQAKAGSAAPLAHTVFASGASHRDGAMVLCRRHACLYSCSAHASWPPSPCKRWLRRAKSRLRTIAPLRESDVRNKKSEISRSKNQFALNAVTTFAANGA
jgi:hypothetical protein